MAALAFAAHEFRIIGDTALFWPAQRALIVADLHLEKASWFAERGQMLPPYDSMATLERLAGLVDLCGARQLWCLGDNFHDVAGPWRMPAPARALLDRLTGALDWRWITGNHDAHLPDAIGGIVMDEAVVGGLVLRHRADPAELRPEMSGHWHPKWRISVRGRGVTRPCFVQSATRLIFPAFGALTGGMDARHPEIRALLADRAEAVIGNKGRTARFSFSM